MAASPQSLLQAPGQPSRQPSPLAPPLASSPASFLATLLPVLPAALVAALLLPGLAAQTSSKFNRGCGPVATWPRLAVSSGTPRIGTSFQVTGSLLAPSRRTITAIGLSNTMWGSIKLPLMLDPRVGPPCQLLVSPDLLLFGTANSQGQQSWKFAVPNDRGLIGLKLYLQMAAQDSMQRDYFTEGLQLTFG